MSLPDFWTINRMKVVGFFPDSGTRWAPSRPISTVITPLLRGSIPGYLFIRPWTCVTWVPFRSTPPPRMPVTIRSHLIFRLGNCKLNRHLASWVGGRSKVCWWKGKDYTPEVNITPKTGDWKTIVNFFFEMITFQVRAIQLRGCISWK